MQKVRPKNYDCLVKCPCDHFETRATLMISVMQTPKETEVGVETKAMSTLRFGQKQLADMFAHKIGSSHTSMEILLIGGGFKRPRLGQIKVNSETFVPEWDLQGEIRNLEARAISHFRGSEGGFSSRRK